MEIVEKTNKYVVLLLDRVRRCAQPVEHFRTDDSLLPPDDESNERLRFVAGLRETAGGGVFEGPLNDFLKIVAEANEAVSKLQDKFLRQVQQFCIKELRQFSEDTYVRNKQAYTDLGYKRDAYDLARHKLKSCKPESIEKRGEEATAAQREFEKQAMVLHEQLIKMPDYHMALAKAIYMCVRAETDMSRQVREIMAKVQSPERLPNVNAMKTVRAAGGSDSSKSTSAPKSASK